MTHEVKTFIVIKYGSMDAAYDILVTEDLHHNYEVFTMEERKAIFDWYFNFVDNLHALE